MRQWLVWVLMILMAGCTAEPLAAPTPSATSVPSSLPAPVAEVPSVQPPPAPPPSPEAIPVVEGSWSMASFVAGNRPITVYLYAPDAVYELQKDTYCGSMAGQVNASAKQWAFYVSVDGAPPALVQEIGRKEFPGGRGLHADRLNEETTILALGDYATCANPRVYDLWAYDHATNLIYRPRMTQEDGKISEARAAWYEVTPEGLLSSKSYHNYGNQFGWHTYTYRWEQAERMWLFQKHEYTR